MPTFRYLLRPVVTGYKGPRKKVLIVDDIAESRGLLVDLLAYLVFSLQRRGTAKRDWRKSRRFDRTSSDG